MPLEPIPRDPNKKQQKSLTLHKSKSLVKNKQQTQGPRKITGRINSADVVFTPNKMNSNKKLIERRNFLFIL